MPRSQLRHPSRQDSEEGLLTQADAAATPGAAAGSSRAAGSRGAGWLSVAVLVAALVTAGVPQLAQAAVGDTPIPGLPEAPTYVVHRAAGPIVVDGRLDDDAWKLAARTANWQWLDTSVPGRLETYAQMCWDDEYLYFAFHAVDPDIWATMQIRDEPVFVEEDFEIFLDPDGDEFNYYEWQINPLGTLYDVIWDRPPQTPGPANRGIHSFDLTPMLSGYQVHGTVWQRDDVDSSWTAEAALSWKGLSEIPGRFRTPPQNGDAWRLGFSRVEAPKPPYWQADWTWPTHGEYNMHIGQRDGYVQFTSVELGEAQAAPQPIPRLYAVDVRVEPQVADGGIQPGREVALIPRIGNRGAGAPQVEVRLTCADSMVTVLDSSATVGPLPEGGSVWAEDGFVVRLSHAVQPGRNIVFQLAMAHGDGRWTGDYFFAFAAGRQWQTAFQLHEGVQSVLVDGNTVWGISRANIWHWDNDGEVLGFYQANDGIPRHARILARDSRGRVWAAGQRGIAYFEGDTWHELTGQQGLPLRDFERICAGADGDMWIASRTGLYRFSTRVEPVWLAAQGYRPGRIRDLVVDGRGGVWVVGDSLVYRFGEDGRRVLGKQDGLPSSRLTALATDTAGNVWVAGVPTSRSYFDGGIGRFDGSSWKVWRRADGLLDNHVTALFADRQGGVWAGYEDGSLSLFDGQAWDHWPALPAGDYHESAPAVGPFTGGRDRFLHDDQGRIWIVGNAGLAQFDSGRWHTWTWRNGLFGGRPQAVVQGANGRVYVSDARSLSFYRD
jgi:hypothetical protein